MVGRVRMFRFLIAAVSVMPLASAAPRQGACNLLGEIFVTNPFDQALMIKGDGSGDINAIRFSNQTQFIRVTVERQHAGDYDPKNLQVGDRVCVQFAAADAKIPARVLVMKRLEIQEHQKRVFSALARNSAFGVVNDLNANSRTIQLKETPGGNGSQLVTVGASGPVAFRDYAPAAQVAREGLKSSWARLRVGDHIFIQGKRDPALPAIRASLIVIGGVREVVGTISSMNGLGQVIELRELGSTHSMTVRIRSDAIYRVSPFVEEAIAHDESDSSAPWDLYRIGFSDLQTGDTVSVLARESEDARKPALGLMLATGFGSYGTNSLSASAPTFWFLDPLKSTQ